MLPPFFLPFLPLRAWTSWTRATLPALVNPVVAYGVSYLDHSQRRARSTGYSVQSPVHTDQRSTTDQVTEAAYLALPSNLHYDLRPRDLEHATTLSLSPRAPSDPSDPAPSWPPSIGVNNAGGRIATSTGNTIGLVGISGHWETSQTPTADNEDPQTNVFHFDPSPITAAKNYKQLRFDKVCVASIACRKSIAAASRLLVTNLHVLSKV